GAARVARGPRPPGVGVAPPLQVQERVLGLPPGGHLGRQPAREPPDTRQDRPRHQPGKCRSGRAWGGSVGRPFGSTKGDKSDKSDRWSGTPLAAHPLTHYIAEEPIPEPGRKPARGRRTPRPR